MVTIPIMTKLFITLGVIYAVFSFVYFTVTGCNEGYHYFNPQINYIEWKRLNIFGVLIFTLLLNFIFLPFSIIYWTSKILIFIFTVGRK